jgi:HD-GYP domain-containing protein (c-di-GMP phosphodiesterase class II)
MDSSKQPNYTVLTIGLDRQVLAWLREELSTLNIKAVSTAQEFEEILELEDVDQFVNTVITGPFVQQIGGDELAQGIRLAFPQCRLLMIATSRSDLEINSLKKNGASEVYIYPGDKGLLDQELDKIVASLGKDPGLIRYRPVQLIDIASGDKLPFDMSVFLPLNNKYIKLVKAGSEVREKQFNKLNEKLVGQVYINSQEMDQFYDYCVEKLADAADPNSAIPETERLAQLQTTTRDLFTSIFDTSESADFSVGQQIMEQSQKIVYKYLERKTGNNFHEQIQNLLGKTTDTYSHASNVSALACLLSMATAVGKPEDLAIAGLFHDMALVDFPIADHEPTPEFLEKLDDQNRKIYMEHPLNAVRVLKTKRMAVTETVAKIIEQHHERVDGKGFPKQLNSAKISMEAQLLAIADHVDYLAQRKASRKRYKLSEAIQYLADSGAYSFELMGKIKKSVLAL